MSGSKVVDEIHLCGDFKFEKSPKTPQHVLLSQSQMYFLLQRLVEVGLYYSRQDQFHGDFHPKNVSRSRGLTEAFDPSGEIKVLDTYLFSNAANGYSKMLQNKMYKTTLSPELLRFYLAQKFETSSLNQEKSEVFSVAILVLAVTFGESFEAYYDYASYKIDFKRLYKRLNRLIKGNYNEELCDLIVQMLDESSRNRPVFSKVNEMLKKIDIKPERLIIKKVTF